jgi:glycosyltransferase involved in cell wall biosynthesis
LTTAPATGVNVHVNAVGAVMGGAQRHLGPFLRAVREVRPAWSWCVWVTDGADTDVPDEVRVERVRVRGQAGRLAWDNRALPRALRQDRADVLIGLTNSAPLRPGVPSVLYQRNALFFDPAWVSRLRGRARLDASLRRALAFAQLRQAREVLVPSAAMAGYLTRWRGFPSACAVTVIPHAVDVSRFPFVTHAWPPADHALRIAHVSHASAHKDQILLVDLVRALVDGGIDAHLVATMAAADAPDYVAAFWARADALGVRDRIQLLGRVHDVAAVLAEADVMVFPSLSESFGFPLIEAMASGIPVVASDIGSSRELLGPDGHYFAPGDAAGAASTIRALLGQTADELRVTLDAAGAFARTLTWQANAEAVVRSIERALAGP